MSGPYAIGLGKRKKSTSSEDNQIFFSSEKTTPSGEGSTKTAKRRRITHADAEVIPKFRPDDETSNVDSWLHKIDQLGEIYGWDATEKQFAMLLRLRGSARKWYDDLDDYSLDWEGWKRSLKNAFPRSVDFVDKLEMMLARNKEDSENMTKYYHEKISLLKKCKISGEEAISCIVKGLPIELRANAKAYQCQTPEELYFGYLSSLENYKRVEAMSSRRSTWRRGGADSGTSSAQLSGVKRCFICRKTGHEARDCGSLLRCDTCQRNGHTAATCWVAAAPGSTR